MAGMARIEIIGNLGKDAEMGATGSGAAKITFTVAHSPRVQQGQQERTDWYRCTLIGKRAESLQQYLTKGQKVYVRGDFEARPWQGRDGQQMTSLDVFVSEVELLGSRQDSQQQAAKPEQAADIGWDDSVPF